MKRWLGSAGICFNERNELLMVKAHGSGEWSVPSGGIEEGESPEECCIREVKEETGYDVRIIEQLLVKETSIKGIEVKTYYFRIDTFGTSTGIQDPDGIIGATAWKSLPEVKTMSHAYPEDLDFLLEQFNYK
ncbi:NUDIX hydrolase [Sporosarcina sp. D27]|uniref:NUDIX hydrolase n=1 Tax=Sporosarcina sp. D27 TaxID=1382305 RepID=UPI00046FC49D|nr:NUDIX hydrolase [Sporosarcina sp. D27]